MSPLARAPVWVRSVLAGLLFGGLMFGWSRLRSDPAPVAVSLVSFLIGGVLFGAGMGLVMARQERRLQADGRRLDDDQRTAVGRAFAQGRLPEDPLLREAAVALARSQFRRANSPIVVVAQVVAFGGLAVWLAVSGEPWWWLGVAFWIGVGAVMLYAVRRSRQRAGRVLQEAGAAAG